MNNLLHGADNLIRHLASFAAFGVAVYCIIHYAFTGSLIAIAVALLAFIYIRIGGILRIMNANYAGDYAADASPTQKRRTAGA